MSINFKWLDHPEPNEFDMDLTDEYAVHLVFGNPLSEKNCLAFIYNTKYPLNRVGSWDFHADDVQAAKSRALEICHSNMRLIRKKTVELENSLKKAMCEDRRENAAQKGGKP